MLDEVKVRERKSAKHGKIYEYDYVHKGNENCLHQAKETSRTTQDRFIRVCWFLYVPAKLPPGRKCPEGVS